MLYWKALKEDADKKAGIWWNIYHSKPTNNNSKEGFFFLKASLQCAVMRKSIRNTTKTYPWDIKKKNNRSRQGGRWRPRDSSGTQTSFHVFPSRRQILQSSEHHQARGTRMMPPRSSFVPTPVLLPSCHCTQVQWNDNFCHFGESGQTPRLIHWIEPYFTCQPLGGLHLIFLPLHRGNLMLPRAYPLFQIKNINSNILYYNTSHLFMISQRLN